MVRTCVYTTLLALTFISLPASAQVRNRQRPNVQQMVERSVNLQKKRLGPQMDQRIDEIDRVCELDAKQKKRLKIAAKGALNKSMGYYTRYLESVYERRFANQAAQNRRFAELKGGKGKAKKKVNRVRRKRVARPVVPYKRPIPWEETIWTSTVKKTLNESQRQVWDKHAARRRAFNRRTGVSVYVSQMDQQLYLTDDQRNKLEKLVDDSFGKDLETAIANQVYAMRGWVGRDPRGRPIIRQLSAKKLQVILSPSQMTVWNGQIKRFGRRPMMMGFSAVAAPAAQVKRPLKKKSVKKKTVKKKVKK